MVCLSNIFTRILASSALTYPFQRCRKILEKPKLPFKQGQLMNLPNNLVAVVVVRHGDYDDVGEELTIPGKRKMETFAEKLRERLAGFAPEDILILHSPEIRARKSAEVIRSMFPSSNINWAGVLCCENYRDVTRDAVITLASMITEKIRVVVCVTHDTATSGLMNAFASFTGKNFPPERSSYGHGFLLTIATGEILRIP